MPRIHELIRVLERVVDALNDVPFPQADLVPKRHELVLHVGLDTRHELYSLLKEGIEEPL